MKVIFLDIDGVLNSEAYFIARGKNFSLLPKFSYDLDPIAVERLNKIMDSTNAEIVLSSTWRLSPLQQVVDALKYKGFKHDIKFTTTRQHMDRGLQILKFVEENDLQQYVVIDDDSYDIEVYIDKDKFVHTRWKTGLLDSHVDYIIEYFKEK